MCTHTTRRAGGERPQGYAGCAGSNRHKSATCASACALGTEPTTQPNTASLIMTNIRVGSVRIPIFTLLASVPAAIKAAQAVAIDDHDNDSPGGEKVTPAEVAEAVGAFLAALGEAALPAMLAANGHR